MTRNMYFTIYTLACVNFFYAMNNDKRTELAKATQETINSIEKCSTTIDNTIKTAESLNKTILAIIESQKKRQQNPY